MDNLLCVARVTLFYGDQRRVVKSPLHGKIEVTDFGKIELHEREEYPLRCLAHVAVFHGRLAHYGRRVDHVLSVGDTGRMEYGIRICRRIKSRMVTKRTFDPHLAWFEIALDHKLAIGGE